MKKNSFVAALLVVALVAVTVSVSASGGPPGGGFYSGQTLQNIGTGISSVIVDLYDSASSVKYTTSFTIPVGGARTFFSSDVPGIPSAFQGSAIVSSDEPLKAIVNVTNRQSGSNGIAGGTAAAQYNGLGTENTGTTVSFPLAKGGFGVKTTAFYIQNAGSAPATFTASFLMGTGLSDPSPVAYSYTSPSLAPGQMAAIIPSDAGVPAGRIGSLSVTSAQPLAGTVLEYETTTAPAKILQGTTGFTPSDYDTRILFPVMKKALGSRSTGLQVQNVDAASVGVTMVYYGAGGTCPSGTFTETVRTLAPKQSTTYLDPAILPAGCLATAAATGTGLIAGVVNEAYIPAVPAGQYQRATTYSAFPANTATIKVVAPVFKQDFGGKRTGLSIQNVGNSTATATAVFQVGATAYTYNNFSIPVGGSFLFLDLANTSAYPTAKWSANARLPNSSLAAVTITSNQPIIAIANEAPLSTVIQDNINYSAFNVAP